MSRQACTTSDSRQPVSAGSLVAACVNFLESTVSDQQLEDGQIARLAGFVFEQCDSACKAPMDNKTAIGRAITHVVIIPVQVRGTIHYIYDELRSRRHVSPLCAACFLHLS